MLGTVINAALIVAGSLLGLLFKHKISQRFSDVIIQGLSLCVIVMGLSSAIKTADTLCLILCMVLGILVGEAINIEARLDRLGETLRTRLGAVEEGNRFTEGFVTASLLYGVGSMAVMGAMEAGIHGNYSILLSKGVLDGISAITFAAAMGVGVALSAIPILIYQGGLTFLFAAVGPVLGEATVLEMSAVGGAIIFAIGLNMLGAVRVKLRVGNMLPAIFFPILYLPIRDFLGTLVG